MEVQLGEDAQLQSYVVGVDLNMEQAVYYTQGNTVSSLHIPWLEMQSNMVEVIGDVKQILQEGNISQVDGDWSQGGGTTIKKIPKSDTSYEKPCESSALGDTSSAQEQVLLDKHRTHRKKKHHQMESGGKVWGQEGRQKENNSQAYSLLGGVLPGQYAGGQHHCSEQAAASQVRGS